MSTLRQDLEEWISSYEGGTPHDTIVLRQRGARVLRDCLEALNDNDRLRLYLSDCERNLQEFRIYLKRRTIDESIRAREEP